MEKGVELALDQKALINPSTFHTKSISVKRMIHTSLEGVTNLFHEEVSAKG